MPPNTPLFSSKMKTLIVVSDKEKYRKIKKNLEAIENIEVIRTLDEFQQAIEKNNQESYDLILTDLYWKRQPLTSRKMRYKSLSYDPTENQFYFDKTQIPLTKKSKALLQIFLKHPEKLLSTNLIKRRYWGDHEPTTTSRNLRSNIQILRSSLKKVNCEDWIVTVRGEGYVLKSNQ